MEQECRPPAKKKRCTNYTSDKGLLFNIHKELLKLIKYMNNPVLKINRNPEQIITKEEIQKARKL